jgi:hypothetical protein
MKEEGRRKKEEGIRRFIYGDSNKAALLLKIKSANVPYSSKSIGMSEVGLLNPKRGQFVNS